jgi:hypothetical protein
MFTLVKVVSNWFTKIPMVFLLALKEPISSYPDVIGRRDKGESRNRDY